MKFDKDGEECSLIVHLLEDKIGRYVLHRKTGATEHSQRLGEASGNVAIDIEKAKPKSNDLKNDPGLARSDSDPCMQRTRMRAMAGFGGGSRFASETTLDFFLKQDSVT